MEENKNKPTKWWQWALVYPTLAIALINATPELVKSIKMGVSMEGVADAEKSINNWRKNTDCSVYNPDWETKILNITVRSKVCESGDILISIKKASEQNSEYKWITIEDMVIHDSSQAGFSFIDSAFAAPIVYQSDDQDGTVLCTSWIDDSGQLLRHISIPENGCYDEVINTYTGEVISKTAVSCEANC